MKSHASLVAQQTRLREWAELVKDCQNRPQGMKIDEWCQLIIPGLIEPSVRTLRATIPENGSHVFR